mgnify:CR=1 FL=1
MVEYYTQLFNDIITGKNEGYMGHKKGQVYDFEFHFKNLLDDAEISCKHCWSFNHQSLSHAAGHLRYDNPANIYKHVPEVE